MSESAEVTIARIDERLTSLVERLEAGDNSTRQLVQFWGEKHDELVVRVAGNSAAIAALQRQSEINKGFLTGMSTVTKVVVGVMSTLLLSMNILVAWATLRGMP